FLGGNDNALDLSTELNLADIPAGTPFQANLLGEDVKGELWYRSEHQLGVTVDAWGDGLLIASSVDSTPAKPKGAAMAILSTYHLADSLLADLDSRWRPWWAQRCPAT